MNSKRRNWNKTALTLMLAGLPALVGACSEESRGTCMSCENHAKTARGANKVASCMEDDGTYAKATFAAGCFWSVEAKFRQTDGVVSTCVGYTGGTVENPSYEQVCSGDTGHAESVHVLFDPEKVSYEELLEAFWYCHNPTTLNRQGLDVGSQYRSAIFYHNESQKQAAVESRAGLEESGRYKGPVVTEITPAGEFYPAEEYHQCYVEKKVSG